MPPRRRITGKQPEPMGRSSVANQALEIVVADVWSFLKHPIHLMMLTTTCRLSARPRLLLQAMVDRARDASIFKAQRDVLRGQKHWSSGTLQEVLRLLRVRSYREAREWLEHRRAIQPELFVDSETEEDGSDSEG